MESETLEVKTEVKADKSETETLEVKTEVKADKSETETLEVKTEVKADKSETETLEVKTEVKADKSETETLEVKTEVKKLPKGKGKTRKVANEADGNEGDASKPILMKAQSSVSDSLRDIDFSTPVKSLHGKTANFKIASWDVDGLRAWLKNEGLSYIQKEKPDVLCVQEIKCNVSKVPAEAQIEGYTTHWLSADKEGYSGVGIYYKTAMKPIEITEGIGIEKHDNEGRVLTAEFEKFYLVNTYIPNSGRGLKRLEYRSEQWDVDFRNYLKSLDAKKPVIWCGNLNVAHQEIDLKNPKTNKKTAGFTTVEREGFTAVLSEGFIDSFRHLHLEEEGAYTYWTYVKNARAKDIGWRLDYFVLSNRLEENLCDSVIRSKVMGSDHCPIVLHLAL